MQFLKDGVQTVVFEQNDDKKWKEYMSGVLEVYSKISKHLN